MAHPTASSSDHYFLSGLGSARRRPAHSSVQPNGPNQTLRSGFGLPRLLLATDWIPVIVWALCFHSGISCTLNHGGIWGQTIPVKLPAPKLNLLFYLAVIRGHAESHRNSLPTANIYINIYIQIHTQTCIKARASMKLFDLVFTHLVWSHRISHFSGGCGVINEVWACYQTQLCEMTQRGTLIYQKQTNNYKQETKGGN